MRQIMTTFSTAGVTQFKVTATLRVPRPLADYASAVDWTIPGGKAP